MVCDSGLPTTAGWAVVVGLGLQWGPQRREATKGYVTPTGVLTLERYEASLILCMCKMPHPPKGWLSSSTSGKPGCPGAGTTAGQGQGQG